MGIAETHCCWVLFLAGLGCSLFLVDFPLSRKIPWYMHTRTFII